MGLALNDVPRRQESHFHERMLPAVTTLLSITILLWLLDKNFQPPGAKKEKKKQTIMFLSETVSVLSVPMWGLVTNPNPNWV